MLVDDRWSRRHADAHFVLAEAGAEVAAAAHRGVVLRALGDELGIVQRRHLHIGRVLADGAHQQAVDQAFDRRAVRRVGADVVEAGPDIEATADDGQDRQQDQCDKGFHAFNVNP